MSAPAPGSGSRLRPRRRHVAWATALLVVAIGGATAFAASIDSGATASRPAVRIDRGLDDVAVVFDIQEVDQFVVEATFQAAEQAGAAAAPGRTASVGMLRSTRGGTLVHAAPDGYLIPMAVLVLPQAAVGGIVGRDVPATLNEHTVAINELTAQTIGAQPGDTVELRAADGSPQAFNIGSVLPYAQIGGSELLMTPEAGTRVGVVDDTQMVVWNIASRSVFDAAVQNVGLVGRTNTKINRSWDARDPDDTLSTARAKALMGEPWYRVVSGDTIAMHPTWMDTYLTDGRILLNASIPVRAQCHVGIVNGLQAALGEVAAAGLGGHIDVSNTNTYGGCFNPRYSRNSGFLSRHAYAMAIDMNTTSNCQGCVPQMNCSVVRIFRKHGFAWGGNFRQPDGMHFEWVGEPRDQVLYPSKYCANIGSPSAQSIDDDVPVGDEVGRDVLMSALDEA